MKKVFTTGQIATICKVAPRTVGKWCDAENGGLKCTRIPGNRKDRRVERSDLIEFLKRKRMKIPPELEAIQYNVLLVGTSTELQKAFAKEAPEILPSFAVQAASNSHEATYMLGCMQDNSPITCVVIDFVVGKNIAVSLAKDIRGIPELGSVVLIGLVGTEDDLSENEVQYFSDTLNKYRCGVMQLAKQIRSLVDARKLPKIPTKCR